MTRSPRRKKMAIGQLIMHGREHLVGITAHKKGLMLLILRYADELRKAEPYFDKIEAKADADAVKLATDLIEQESGKFQPEKMPNEYARAVHELVQAKIEQRAPEVEIETAKGERPRSSTSWTRSRRACRRRVRPRSRKRCAREWERPRQSDRLHLLRRATKPSSRRTDALAFTGADKLPTHINAETTRIVLRRCASITTRVEPSNTMEAWKLGVEPRLLRW